MPSGIRRWFQWHRIRERKEAVMLTLRVEFGQGRVGLKDQNLLYLIRN